MNQIPHHLSGIQLSLFPEENKLIISQYTTIVSTNTQETKGAKIISINQISLSEIYKRILNRTMN